MLTESTGTKTGQKRFRYIFAGDIRPGDPISSYRLIAGRSLSCMEDFFCIRVEFENGVTLEKWDCDPYSHCYEDKPVRYFNAIVYDRNAHREDKELTRMWLAGEILPYEF